MAKHLFYFDKETLSYRKITRGFSYFFKRILGVLFSSLIIGAGLTFAFLMVVDSPKEKQLKRENEQYKMQLKLVQDKLTMISDELDELQQRDEKIYRIIFEADPIPMSVRKGGFGGSNKYKHLEDLSDAELVIGTNKKLDGIAKQLYIQSKSYDEIVSLVSKHEDMLASLPSIQPISNKDLTRTASGWGYRIDPIYKIRKFHYGLDFTSPTGTDVYATGNGRVSLLKFSPTYGNYIIIDHGYGYQTVYAHLSKYNVRYGQKVNRGDVIAFVGNTGKSTGSHLHYEVHKNGVQVNPINFLFDDLSPEQYEKMIEISSNSGQTLD